MVNEIVRTGSGELERAIECNTDIFMQNHVVEVGFRVELHFGQPQYPGYRHPLICIGKSTPRNVTSNSHYGRVSFLLIAGKLRYPGDFL